MSLGNQNGGPYLLVIEDDLDVRETLIEILAEEGYRALASPSGQEALKLLRRLEVLPEVILLDLVMPGMDGWRFRELQMAETRLKHIPCVVLSADGKPEGSISSLEGCLFLRKPISIAALLDLVSRYLPLERVL